jgi:cold-inducible RNA-binding protein
VSVRLFIGNLPYTATEAELREHLSSVGAPSQVVLPTDRETGRPRGFAFVDYVDRAVAEEAIRRFNQQPFRGRPLAVSEARPREDRPAGPRPGGFSGPRPVAAPGGFSSPRPGGFSPRPAEGGTGPGGRARNFGPDAPPKNKRKPPRKDDRGPKGPIKERPVGRLYDNDEDWRAKDKRKPSRKESERGPRGPIKERPVGRLYDADEDWRAADEEPVVDDFATSAKNDDVDDDES